MPKVAPHGEVVGIGEMPDAGKARRPPTRSHMAVAMTAMTAMASRLCGLGCAREGQHGESRHAAGEKLAVHCLLLCL
jgi:hypothetical protein